MSTEDNIILNLENQLCFAFYACSREMLKLYRPILSELGITYTQYITLLVLWENDGITVKELGKRLYLDSGTLTPLLKKLQALELITRTRDKADERNVVIELTDKGQAMKEQAKAVPGSLLSNLDMDMEEIMSLRSQIHKLMSKINSLSPQADLMKT
ncbi:MarR family transcriptional regulator [Paenibacillaceae bacterium]|nr:MarR family transcriptional regulator [Paenibacillaceae bacterium]